MRVHLAVHVHELAQEPVSVSQRLTSGKKQRGELIGDTAEGGSDSNVLVNESTSGTFGWGHGDLGSSVSPAYARRCVKAVEERLKSAHPSAQIEIEWRHVSSSLDLLRSPRSMRKRMQIPRANDLPYTFCGQRHLMKIALRRLRIAELC